MMTEQQFLEFFRARVAEGLKLWDIPSVSIGIIKDGKTVLCEGFGNRDLEQGLPATKDTLYQIGSCTKAFTAALVAILVDQGKLDWDEPIVNYMPQIRFYDDNTTSTLTVRDILCHRSGLPRHEYSWYGSSFTKDELMHNLRYLEPNQPIRTKFQYNNYGYILAGYIVEKLTGKSWEQCVQEYIFEPLGMKRSNMFVDVIRNDADHAEPYDRTDPAADMMVGMEKIPFYKMPEEDYEKGIGAPLGPAGTINSSAEEMLRWVALQLNNGELDGKRVISEASMAQLHMPHMLVAASKNAESKAKSYALGWSAEAYRGHDLIQHGGNINGFTAYTGFIPELNLGVVAYANMNVGMLGDALAHDVYDYYIGVEDTNWVQRDYDRYKEVFSVRGDMMKPFTGEKKEGTVWSHPLEDYAGTYFHAGYMPVEVTLEEGKLYLHFNGVKTELRHFHYDTFITSDLLGGGEIPPGLPVQFSAEAFRSTVGALTMPLCFEPGAEPTRFTRKD